jgi:hypothetical protein
MTEPRDMIIPLLREMRDEMHAGFTRVEERLTRIEASQKSLRNAMTSDTLFSKFILGDFEERLALVEQRLGDLTPSKS